MATQAHHYDHASYLTTQHVYLGATAASASGTNCQFIAPCNLKLRRLKGVVVTAGTTATNALTARIGTTSIGAATAANSAAGFELTFGDLNATLTQGSVFNVLKSDDATGVSRLMLEVQVPAGTQLPI